MNRRINISRWSYRRSNLTVVALICVAACAQADLRAAGNSNSFAENVGPQGVVPDGGANSLPFWQYAIFGSAIGASGIVIGPPPAGGGAPEIVIGCNSANDFGADN